MASTSQRKETLALGEQLGLFRDVSLSKLSKTGEKFADLSHWKMWHPSAAQREALQKADIYWHELPAVEERPAVIDLFSGAGGLGLGFEMSGFSTVIAVDNDAQALAAHKLNFPECATLSDDIHELASEAQARLQPLCGHDRPLAGVVGGPPCQGFSYIGERVVTDERSMLTSRFMDIVDALQPDFFVMENVAGLLTIGARPRFTVHVEQYSKTIGPSATMIAAALPDQPSAPNRRERQYNKRLVSAAIKSFHDSLSSPPKSKTLLAEIRAADSLLKSKLSHSVDFTYSGASRMLAMKCLAKQSRAIQLIAVASVISNKVRLSKKTAELDAKAFVTSLARGSDSVSVVCKQLLKSYEALETAHLVGGLSVGPVLRHLMERASRHYEVTPPKILSAAWYGAPQDRRRLFLVGVHKRLKTNFRFPEPTHFMPDEPSSLWTRKPAVTCEQAIGDLPDVDTFEELLAGDMIGANITKPATSEFARWMRGEKLHGSDFSLPRKSWDPFAIDCCKRTTHSAHVLERLSSVPHGVLDRTSGKTRLKPNDVAHTLRAGTREAMGSHTAVRPVHYAFDRVISVREGARLMGYPDWMTFHPTKWHGFRLVGNGVPAQLGCAIANALMQQLYGRD